MTTIKRFLTLSLIAALAMQVWGVEAILNSVGTKDVATTEGASVSLAFDGVTCTCTKHSGNQPGFYTSSGIVRYYSSDVMTLSVASGNTISQIDFVMNSGSVGTASPGTLTGNQWKGSAESVSFTGGGTVKISSITVTYSTGGGSPTLSSISVKTAPTKVSYTEGEYFDPTGLVITRTYSDASTSDYTYADHTSEFTFSPTTSTALTTSNTSVSITYGGKSTSQAITVTSGGGSGGGSTATFVWGTNPSKYSSGSSSVTEGVVTFTGAAGTGSTPTRCWSDGLRMYNGSTANFSVPAGYVITRIEGYSWFNYDNATGSQSVDFSGWTSSLTCKSDVTVTYAAAVSYTITASSNNNAYGTVSVSGNIITATPASGYVANGYTLNSGTATISQSGNVYTVTPSSDCNITINFEPIPTYAIRFYNNGTQVGATQNIANGGTAVPPADPAGCEDFTFLGWWTAELAEDNTTTQTWVTDFTVSGAQDYYAAYSHAGGESTIVSFDPSVDTSFPKGGITLSVSSGTLTNGTDYRVYKGGATLTISSIVGNISNIALTYENASNDGGGWATNYTPNSDSWTSPGTDGEQAHITSIVVTVGAVYYTTHVDCRDCATPTLSFGETTIVNKFVGDSKFTITATPSNNPMGGTITYSSNKPTKASVNATTGEVTILDAMSDEPITITATLGKVDDGVDCQKKATASYTLNIYHRVIWSVNDDEYTTGDPTRQSIKGGQITQMPEAPNGESLCGGKVFIGWTTEANKDWSDDVAPSPLYNTTSDMSSVYITENKTFYAIFATSSSSGSGGTYAIDFESTTGTYTDWTFSDMTSRINGITGVKAHGGSYHGTTGSSNPANLTTVNKIESPTSISFYVTRLTTNNTASSWTVQTSSDGSNWDDVGVDQDAKSMAKGTWVQVERDLSSLSNVYVRIHYEGSTANRGIDDLVLSYGESTTYSDFSTTCGECLPAPTSPTVTPKENRATITWTAVPNATGYTVTCTGGEVSVVGTTATITGLTSETTYNFSIRSQGSDPYTCFPKYNGSFTTTACEDSPVLGDVIVTTTTATIPWTCDAATSTIRIYEDDACNTQVGSDHTSCTSPYTVENLTSNTTYYYKIWSNGTCPSIIGSFTTEEIKLDIAEWQEDAVVISYNGDADLTLTTYTEETHGDPHENIAEDIFFSKYFEAAGAVKLLAIFNGTLETVDLSEYALAIAQASTTFTKTKFKDIVKSGGGNLTEDELLLKSNEELILISYTTSDNDATIIACAQEHEEDSHFSKYIKISTPELQFNGDDAVALVDPDDTKFIDLIGAGTYAGGSNLDAISSCSGVGGSGCDFMDSPGGWYTTTGYQANTDNTETSDYALSTNRCLLIRRKFVKSGHIAVELNKTDFVTLGSHTYKGESRQSEWKGVQIPGSTTQGTKPGLTNACTGFEVVGSYNYNEYYVDFEINGTPTVFDDLKSNPFDGTYVIPVSGLNDKACTQVRIELKDGSDNLVIRKDVKVPIMISGTKETTDAIFHSNYKDAVICKECDVVVLGSGTLTKVADGTSGDIPAVRNVKVYPGGQLVVPAGTEYSVNSLAFRRDETGATGTADIRGTVSFRSTPAYAAPRRGIRKAASTSEKTYLDIQVDPTNWHYICLPGDCNVADITFSTGEPATLGTDYLLKRYDGANRAATQAGGCWEMVAADATLKKGIGYIFSLPGDGAIKKEIRFPMSNAVVSEELANKTVNGVRAYGAGDATVRDNHKGWNLIGNPYLMPYTSDITDPLLTGYIVPDYPDGYGTDPTVTWDGHYKFDEDPTTHTYLRYIVVPINNGWTGYEQEVIANHAMPPFTSYFVQIGGANTDEQGIDFHLAKVNRSPVRRQPAEYEEVEDRHPVWCAVTLTNPKGEKDETTLLISDNFTDGYDMMDDLTKWRGTYYQYAQITTAPVLASRNNEGEMAFNALPDSSALAGVPLNYFAASQGFYTFAYDDKYDRDMEVKEVKLWDKTTNQWYDLMNEPYSFSTARTDNKDRFVLSVRVERKHNQTTTDLENAGTYRGDKPRKLLINGLLYIQRGKDVYDVTGKQLLNR